MLFLTSKQVINSFFYISIQRDRVIKKRNYVKADQRISFEAFWASLVYPIIHLFRKVKNIRLDPYLVQELEPILSTNWMMYKTQWISNLVLKGKSTLNTSDHDQVLQLIYDDVP